MAEKISTIIITIDLSCPRCHKKIKKILCKLQDKWQIKSIIWDEKNNKITISGPFCAEKLRDKLCCKACKIMQEIEIVKPKPPPEPPKPAPEPPKPAPEPPKPAPEPPKPAPEPPKPAPEPPKPAPEPPKPAPEPPKPAPEPPKPAPEPPVGYPPYWVMGPVWCCKPCDEGHKPCSCGCGSGHRPCSCGCNSNRGYYDNPPPPVYSRPCQTQFFCEEDPACIIM